MTASRTPRNIRLLTSEEVHLAEGFVGRPILGKAIRIVRGGRLARALWMALLEHRATCEERRVESMSRRRGM